MDPQVTYNQWRDADDSAEAAEHAVALRFWLSKGGFPPRWSADERREFEEWCVIALTDDTLDS